jgi:hypothetical protein
MTLTRSATISLVTTLTLQSRFVKRFSTRLIFWLCIPPLAAEFWKASSRHAAIRWFVVPKYRNYLIFYQLFKDSIVVLRVLHAARDWTRFFPVSRDKNG